MRYCHQTRTQVCATAARCIRGLLAMVVISAALLAPADAGIPRAGRVAAQLQSFGERRPFGPASGAWDVAVGDLDDDGHLDLVTSGYGEPGRVYFNPDGDGTFNLDMAQVYRPEGALVETGDLALGDLDGDGDLDIVTGNSRLSTEAPGAITGGAQDVVYINDNGTFAPTNVRTFGPADSLTWSVALGDMNGDGALDIVTGNYGQANAVFLNDGTGAFLAAQPFGAADSATRSVALGDLDGDGALDIVVGNEGQPDMVYFNDGTGSFPEANVRTFGPADSLTWSVALSDMNGDGALDIVTGTDTPQNTIFLNDGAGQFSPDNTLLFGSGTTVTRSLAVGDVDGDGLLDVVSGSLGPNEVSFGSLTDVSGTLSSFFTEQPFGGNDRTSGVALGDLDGNGTLDIVVGSDTQGAVYLNQMARRSTNVPLREESQEGSPLGDLNGDGYIDLVGYDAAAGRLVVYPNDGSGRFPDADRRLVGPVQPRPSHVAVGDVTGDGALDIVTTNYEQPGAIYVNDGSGNFPETRTFGPGQGDARHVALGDLDNDGDLDIVTGNFPRFNNGPIPGTGRNMIYLNDGAGNFPDVRARPFGSDDFTSHVALGDLDNDGDLDIVSDDGSQSRVHVNDGTGDVSDEHAAPFRTVRGVALRDRALGDLNGDGHLDIVSVYFGQSWIDFNDGTGNFPDTQARPFGRGDETGVYLGDLDGDGDLDIVTAAYEIYRNDGRGNFSPGLAWNTKANEIGVTGIGDVNNDGTPDLIALRDDGQLFNNTYLNYLGRPTGLPNTPPRVRVARPGSVPAAGLFSTPEILGTDSQVVPVRYRLADPEGDPVREVRAFFSLNGGGDWREAVPTAATDVTDLEAAPTGTEHTFAWDLFASGFFGQSDNVVFRIEAYPGVRPTPNSVPGSYQHPYVAAQTTPFRVRGTQVRVQNADGTAAPDALVYRLPPDATSGAERFARATGEPFRTDAQGFLQGRGAIIPGDRLIALAPITGTATYTLYHTSAPPTATGLDAAPVSAPGVQDLTVSADHPLILFNLDVALEWDARNDPQYLTRLEDDFRRASAALYDWTDGQAVLGNITIHHDRGPDLDAAGNVDPNYWWNHAHIRIYATNRLRPNANQGGIVSAPISETVTVNGTPQTLTYEPGQIRMGAVWNRYGEAEGTIGEDWPRTLAHELGHYALFLDDNYLGLDPEGVLMPVETCPGAMADPYIDNASELHPDAGWPDRCANTLSNQTTGRSDWATIKTFYNQPDLPFALNQPDRFDANPGPRILPLEVTQVRFVAPQSDPAALATPIIYLTGAQGTSVQPAPDARAFLFQPDRQRLIDLGRPVLDRVEATGARPGDRLCVYDLAQSRLGCEPVSATDQQLTLRAITDWQPELIITPVTSRTVQVAVRQVASGLALRAQLYPVDARAPAPIALTEDDAGYTGMFTLDDPIFTGYVHIWVDEGGQRREIVSDYTLGGNPGSNKSRSTPGENPGSNKSRSVPRNSPGSNKSRSAPVLSGDGQAIVYTREGVFAEGEFYALQSTNVLAPPAWSIPVGRAYRLTATAQAPSLADNASISIGYLSGEVPPGTEGGIKVYFRPADSSAWQQLPTRLDTERNEASAPARGPGVYALMTGIDVQPGWNLFAYPWPDTQAVPDALARINAQRYTTVYGYEWGDAADPWKVYDIDAPAWVNDLSGLRYGQGYWVRVLATGLARTATTATAEPAGSLPIPPATYYARAAGLGLAGVRGGASVVARIDGTVCGRGATFAGAETGNQVVFVVTVSADDGGAHAGCGLPGRRVTFEVAGEELPLSVRWDNSRPRDLAQPGAGPEPALYLPLVGR